jgi:hypothetical protein
MRVRGISVLLTLVMVAGCGGGSGESVVTTGPGATSIAGTSTSGPTTTTLPPTTTTTVDPLLVDIFSIEPIPPSEPPTGVNALLGGAPDEVAALLIVRDLEGEGIALTGVTIAMWPISGTGESLIVIEFDESAGEFAEDDDQSGLLFERILAHPVLDEQNTTRLVLRIVGVDEDGPYVFTMTANLEDMRQAIATGEPLEDGAMQFGLERVDQ